MHKISFKRLLLSEFLGKQQGIRVLLQAETTERVLGTFLFTALSKEAQIPPFPQSYLGPQGSQCFIRSHGPLAVPFPLPEEPP